MIINDMSKANESKINIWSIGNIDHWKTTSIETISSVIEEVKHLKNFYTEEETRKLRELLTKKPS